MTLRETIRIIETFGSQHLMVDNVLFGADDQIDISDYNGIVLWFYVENAIVNSNALTISFNVAAMDVLQSDLSNEKDGLSDTLKVCLDLCAYFNYYQNSYGIEYLRTSQISSFVHKATSDYVGYNVKLDIKVKNDFDYCEIPMIGAILTENLMNIETEDGYLIVSE